MAILRLLSPLKKKSMNHASAKQDLILMLRLLQGWRSQLGDLITCVKLDSSNQCHRDTIRCFAESCHSKRLFHKFHLIKLCRVDC